MLSAQHLNPDYLRYELHRVRVVEATLRAGERHRYKRRVFYIDEDSWNILLVDIYDNDNQLWRAQEAHVINHYDVQVFMPTTEVYLDLQSSQYLALGLNNETRPPIFNAPMKKKDFTPTALRRSRF